MAELRVNFGVQFLHTDTQQVRLRWTERVSANDSRKYLLSR